MVKKVAWVSASMSPNLKQDFDSFCDLNGYNKSELIRKLIRNTIYEKGDV